MLVGLDRGSDAADGETAKQYGVPWLPSFFVLDRHGNVAFTTATDVGGDPEKCMAEMKLLAEELQLPWPIDKDVSEEEASARLLRINELLCTKEIEKALSAR